MTLRNTSLVDYGIQKENSDYRAHVCVVAREVVIFPTRKMAEVVGRFKATQARTGALVTSRGAKVPVTDIPGVQIVHVSDAVMQHANFKETDTTSAKGEKAVLLVRYLLKHGRIALPMNVVEVDEGTLQIFGTDILVELNASMQVKCDYRGGERNRGGTGNLYIETAECNPYGAHW